MRYAKTGAAAWAGHLDLVRELPRALRRAGLTPWLSQGFRPRPLLTFGPALPLGWQALWECVDVSIGDDIAPDALVERLAAATQEGLDPLQARRLSTQAPRLSRVLQVVDYVVCLQEPSSVADALGLAAADRPEIAWTRKDKTHAVAWQDVVLAATPCPPEALPGVLRAATSGPAVTLRLRLREPMPRPTEVLAVALGLPEVPTDARVCRTALWALDAEEELRDPMEDPMESA